MCRCCSIFSIIAAAFVGIPDARPAESSPKPAQAEEVTVTGEPTGSLTSSSTEESAKQRMQVPGNFTIKSAEAMKIGRASSFEDLLQRTAGVFLQSDNGSEVSKVSIRGSGITSEDEPIGVMFLLDGLNYNQGDGETILEDLDVNALSHAEVFRGAAGFKYGALTLGGAVNLVPLTGYNAAPLQLRLEEGSYGYIRAQISGAAVRDALDAFGSISFRRRDGFREHSRDESDILFADAGYKLNPQIENRFYVTLSRIDRDLPGGLTKSQMANTPWRADSLAIAQDWNKNWFYARMADKLSVRTEAFDLDAGAFWFHRDLEQRGFFSTDFRKGIEMFYSDNFGVTLNFVSRHELFGHQSNFTVGLSPQVETENNQNYENLSGRTGATTARGETIALNIPFYLEEQFYVTQRVSILAGAQTIYVRRDFRDHFLADADGDQSHCQTFLGFNPKLGAIYELDRRTQIFANFSRSWQPPSFDDLVEFEEGPDSSVVYTSLQPQRAWTIEIGTRGEWSRVQWELALYRSWLRNELLELNDAFGNDIGATNVNRSIHQGIEASLKVQLFEGIVMAKHGDRAGDRLSLDQSYTVNDFRFDNDRVYGNNRIAGIPIHVYEAQLLYETPLGFYAGSNVQWNISRYPADHANQLFADDYALIGFRAGYRQTSGMSIFLDCKNLTNQRYASAIDAIADARTGMVPKIFHPGDGRAIYGGVSWSW